MIEIIQLLENIFLIFLVKFPSKITMINNVTSIILETAIDKEILKDNKTISKFLILDNKDLFINPQDRIIFI